MDLIKPMKLKVWGRPAAANFALGGMASGLYLLSFIMEILAEDSLRVIHPIALKLLAPVLVCLGFLALTVEAGRPMRSRYLLRALSCSWMSRETLAGGVFVLFAIVDFFVSHIVLQAIAALAAIGLILSQGLIVYRARAVISWNVSLIPLVFFTSALSTGFGLMLMLAAPGKGVSGLDWMAVGLMCVGINLVVWVGYLLHYHDAEFREATKELRRPIAWIVIVGIGHVLPVIILLLMMIAGNFGDGFKLQQCISILTGLFIIVGGLSQKLGLLQRTNIMRGIAMGSSGDNTKGVKHECRTPYRPEHGAELDCIPEKVVNIR